jgi:hypothetical protein
MLINVFLRAFLFSVSLSYLCAPSALASQERIKNSSGVLSTFFDSNEAKSVNGFAVKKGSRVYFVTVAHVSMIFDRPAPVPALKAIVIYLPELKLPFEIVQYFKGDDLKNKQAGETIDVLVVDITQHISKSPLLNEILDYKDLISFDMKSVMDKEPNRPVSLIGYPASRMKKDSIWVNESYAILHGLNSQVSTKLELPKEGYGGLISLPVRGENFSGFYLKIESEGGDCGRAAIVNIGEEYKIAGLLKTGQGNQSIAIDGTAIARTIDFAETGSLSHSL